MKIAICVPHNSEVKAEFAVSLANLNANIALNITRDATIVHGRGTIFPHIRNDIAAAALAWGADWLLWLDADHKFPPDAAGRLLRHGQPIVGCNYPRRRREAAFPAASKGGELLYTTREKAEAGELEEADTIGLGLCLIRRDVFEQLRQPFFRLDYDSAGDFVTEDVSFFGKARQAGFRVLVDHALSWQVGHIDEQILTNEGTGRGYADTAVASSGAK